jgi:hypothetical protein
MRARCPGWGVSYRSWNGVSEPAPDRGDVDGSAPDEVAFVIPGGDGAELAEGTLDGVALLAGGVEGGWPTARAAAPQPVAGLICGLSDGGLDATLAREWH